jgi:hypothetical protein
MILQALKNIHGIQNCMRISRSNRDTSLLETMAKSLMSRCMILKIDTVLAEASFLVFEMRVAKIQGEIEDPAHELVFGRGNHSSVEHLRYGFNRVMLGAQRRNGFPARR